VSERGVDLMQVADAQISELIGLLSGRTDATLGLSCPGRGALGDGSIAACAFHTANSYHRIARFVQARDAGAHGGNYTSENAGLQDLLGRLSATAHALSILADLTDEQLDEVPPAGGMKFSDGQRTLEQILRSLLKHQCHNVDALKDAVSLADGEHQNAIT
jgi:hypothetical protein